MLYTIASGQLDVLYTIASGQLDVLYTIASGQLEGMCWRQFAAQ